MGNKARIASFHFNAACCFTNRRRKQSSYYHLVVLVTAEPPYILTRIGRIETPNKT